jgi:hypothetical protein
MLLSPLLFSYHHSCVLYIWEKAMEFWHGGHISDFATHAYGRVGMGLVQREACGTCVHMVLSCHCINY